MSYSAAHIIELSVEVDDDRDDDFDDDTDRADLVVDFTDDLVDDFEDDLEDFVDVVGVLIPFVVTVPVGETSWPLNNLRGSIGMASSLKQ